MEERDEINMCGIVGVAGTPFAPYYAMKMTVKQDHRGKDATGVSWIETQKESKDKIFYYYKYAIAPVEFSNKYAEQLKKLEANKIAICHNRAASCNFTEKHMDKECHPFFSEDGTFCLMQNGAVGFADILGRYLKIKDHKFSSGIDSEVLLHILEEFIEVAEGDRAKAFLKFREIVVGNVIVLFNDGEMWGFASNSSFYIVKNGNSIFMASELNSILKIIDDELADKSCMYDTAGGTAVKIFTKNNGEISSFELFGKWNKYILKDDTFKYKNTITCDFCRTLTKCERITIGGAERDRCHDCFTKGLTTVAPITETTNRIQVVNGTQEDGTDINAICSLCYLPHMVKDTVICGKCGRILCNHCFSKHIIECDGKYEGTSKVNNINNWLVSIILDKILINREIEEMCAA